MDEDRRHTDQQQRTEEYTDDEMWAAIRREKRRGRRSFSALRKSGQQHRRSRSMLSKDRRDREPQSTSRLLRRERRRTTSRDFREESRQPDGYRSARDDCFDSPLLLRSRKRQYHDDNSEADQPREKNCNSAPDSHPESSYYRTRKSGHDSNSRHDERLVEAHYRHILEKLRDRTTTIDRIDTPKRKPVPDD
jgi:hypothetical protein